MIQLASHSAFVWIDDSLENSVVNLWDHIERAVTLVASRPFTTSALLQISVLPVPSGWSWRFESSGVDSTRLAPASWTLLGLHLRNSTCNTRLTSSPLTTHWNLDTSAHVLCCHCHTCTSFCTRMRLSHLVFHFWACTWPWIVPVRVHGFTVNVFPTSSAWPKTEINS